MGGLAPDATVTKKVYHYKPVTQQWEEFLQPVPTARYQLTVISTQSALTVCGGTTEISGGPCTTVEVYTTETSQWHTTDPLPVPCWGMSSATINNTAYLLGGLSTVCKPTKTVLYVPVASPIQRATSHPQQSASAAQPDSTSSAWKTLQDTQLELPAVALGECCCLLEVLMIVMISSQQSTSTPLPHAPGSESSQGTCLNHDSAALLLN